MEIEVITAPTTEPITLAEAKNYLKQDFTGDDAIITAMIVTARQYVEEYTQRSYAAKTLRVTFATTESDFRLPYPTVGTITAAEVLTSPDATAEAFTDYSRPWSGDIITLNDPQEGWSYRFTYTTLATSFGADTAKSAMFMIIGDMYANRGNSVVGTITATVKTNVDAILAPLRRSLFFGV